MLDLRIRPYLLALTSLALLSAACGDSDDTNDSGTTPDAGVGQDAQASFDSGPRVDAGFPDSGPRPDAGFDNYCVTNGQVVVGNINVSVDETSDEPTSPTGANSLTSCIDRNVTPSGFQASLYIRGCLNVMGSPPTQAELDELEIVGFAADVPVDPSYDLSTGEEASPNAIVNPGFTLSRVPASSCPSRYRVDLGFDAVGGIFMSEVPYILRIRSSTTSAGTWMPTYINGVIVRNENIVGGGADVSLCTSQSCYMAQDFFIARRSGIQSIAAANPGQVVGATDLSDGLGTGYLAIETLDCGRSPMAGATAGAAPAPNVKAYLDGSFSPSTSATQTSTVGIYMGLGFPGFTASSSMAMDVVGAVGVNRDGVCTEEFGADSFKVYPDALTVWGSGAETTIHGP